LSQRKKGHDFQEKSNLVRLSPKLADDRQQKATPHTHSALENHGGLRSYG